MSTELKLIPGTLPASFCPSTEQERYNKYFALGYASQPTGVGYTIKVSDTAPSAAERSTTLWMPLSKAFPGGEPADGKVFYYQGGYWTCPHPVPPSSVFRRVVAAGNEASVWLLDGGDGDDPSSTAPTDYTGAMWEVDHNFDGQTLMGVGTIGDGSGAITESLIATDIGQTNGEVALGTDNLPEHRHESGVPYTDTVQEPPYGETPITEAHTLAFTTVATGGSGNANAYTQYTGFDSSDITKVNIIQPSRGIWVVKRTARKFWVVS